jgi:hypothetical protein
MSHKTALKIKLVVGLAMLCLSIGAEAQTSNQNTSEDYYFRNGRATQSNNSTPTTNSQGNSQSNIRRVYEPTYGKTAIDIPEDYTEDFYFFRRPVPKAYDQPSTEKAYIDYYNPNPRAYYVVQPPNPNQSQAQQTQAQVVQNYSDSTNGQIGYQAANAQNTQQIKVPADYTQDFYFFRRPVPTDYQNNSYTYLESSNYNRSYPYNAPHYQYYNIPQNYSNPNQSQYYSQPSPRVYLPNDYTQDFYFFRRPVPSSYDTPSNNNYYYHNQGTPNQNYYYYQNQNGNRSGY